LAKSKFLSLEDFSISLDQELIWRRKEISDLRQAIRDCASTSQNSLIRAFVPLSYAHWEGFVISVAKMYFSFITTRRLKYSELEKHFMRLTFLKRLDALSQSKSSLDGKLKLLLEIDRARELRFSSVSPDIIDSGSNLNTDQTRQICTVCGISADFLSGHEDFLDVELLKRRNQIAHGEWATIGADQVDSLSDGVLDLMTMFRNEIENAIVGETYRAKQA